jgi:hypothetical protein
MASMANSGSGGKVPKAIVDGINICYEVHDKRVPLDVVSSRCLEVLEGSIIG